MPSSARELQIYPYIPRLTEYFGAGPSGGNVLVPARTLRRSRLKGRCRKAAPLRIPRPHRDDLRHERQRQKRQTEKEDRNAQQHGFDRIADLKHAEQLARVRKIYGDMIALAVSFPV